MMNIRITVGEKFNFEIGKKYDITTFKDLGYQETRTYYEDVIVIGVNSQSLHLKDNDENSPFGRYPKIMLNELESIEEVTDELR